LKAFAAAAGPGNFIVTDMDETGAGQWEKWHGDWGLPFVWTALHVFGGNMGIKGNLSEINAIPFEAPPLAPVRAGYDPMTQAVGVGYTPEGLDQNPAYYELLQESAFKPNAESNVTDWLVRRAHRRYGLLAPSWDVGSAWADIGESGYGHDGQVHDPTAVGTLSPTDAEPWTGFGFGPPNGKHTPTAGMCKEWRAWRSLVAAAPAVVAANVAIPPSQKFGKYPKTFSYDLVDIGREVLAQLTIPVAREFNAARKSVLENPADVNRTGALYVELLLDLDKLLATDTAFMLGPWLASARRLGGTATDCNGTVVGDLNCADFMEWNARSQLTTWKPTPKVGPLGQPGDYAKKHWSGLISGYYAPRVRLYMQHSLAAIAEHKSAANSGAPAVTPTTHADAASLNPALITLAYEFQTAFGNGYPMEPVGDPAVVSAALISKWGRFFSACTGVPAGRQEQPTSHAWF
jgi:alpha-N-acetylglucosaminidase